MGLWIALQLIQTYGIQAHLGVINSVNREIPYSIGRGAYDQAQIIENVGRTSILAISILLVAILLLVYSIVDFAPLLRKGILFVGLATALNLNIEYYVGLFKATGRFGKASVVQAVRALLMLGGLVLVYGYSFDGLCWRAVIVAATPLLVCVSIDGWKYPLDFNWIRAKELVAIGMPIMILSYAIVLYSSLDRLAILAFLSNVELGYFALGIAVSGAISVFPSAIGQVYYPEMVQEYARHPYSKRLLLLCMKASGLATALSISIGVLLFFLLPWLVGHFFMNYRPGLHPTLIALVAYCILALTSGPNYFLIATVQKRKYLAVLFGAAAFQLILGYFLSGLGLNGIAWSILIGSFFYVAALWFLVFSISSVKPDTFDDP
jgi:O-antigen/teichoic acid export membrane protein